VSPDLTNGIKAVYQGDRFQLTNQVNLLKMVKKLRILPSPSGLSELIQVI
jgi:hypothetical protein